MMKPFRIVLANIALCFLVCVSPRPSSAAPAEEKSSPPGKDVRAALESARSLAKQERWPAAVELGRSDASRGVHNYEEARATLLRARRRHPKSAAILVALGSLEIEAESFDAAIAALRSAAVFAPNHLKRTTV